MVGIFSLMSHCCSFVFTDAIRKDAHQEEIIMQGRFLLLFLMTVFLSVHPVYAADDVVEEAGDVLMVVIPLAGLGGTLFFEDGRQGTLQFIKALASSEVITQGLKHIVDKKRPNGEDESFPSGHSARAFMGAGFIHKRYGWKYAVPAYLGAAYVGYSRVSTDNHYVEDVLAGAAIGILNSFFFTTPYNELTMTPVAEAGFYGLKIYKRW
jgi:membrane-associated phospholipid phosphatase